MAAASVANSAAADRASRARSLSAGDSGNASQAPRMVLPSVSARDRRTLEIRHFLPVPRGEGTEMSYALDAYFYFPRSFGIGSSTWTREQFYRDANTYMRLHAPSLQLSELADLENENNPGTLLRRQLPLLMTECAPNAESLGMLAQLLGAELADAATGAVQRLHRLVASCERNGVFPALEKECARICCDVLRALGSVRRLRAKTSAYRALIPPALLNGLAFAEEYACAIVDEQFTELAMRIETSEALRDGLGTAARLRARICLTIEQINRHRLEQGFAGPWDEPPEYFSHRMALLKDALEQALYVDTRRLARDPYYQNSAAMVAASLAATWATLAQIPLLSGDLVSEHRLLVVGMAIGAYVLKDRIKEWTRLLLSSRILRWDHDREVVGNALARVGFGEFSGRARERVRYVDDLQIPTDVIALRRAHRKMQSLENDREQEQVLHYYRWISFRCGVTSVPPGFGVQDLFRLSLAEIVKNLDDPTLSASYFDHKNARFRTSQVPKVYHLNVILKLRDLKTGEQAKSRTRVVVNQQGIVRLEPVLISDLL